MNRVSLERRRRSFRVGAGPRVFGPVGAQLTGEQLADACPDDKDFACQLCGMHVCACPSSQTTSTWQSPTGQEILRDIQKAIADLRDVRCPSCSCRECLCDVVKRYEERIAAEAPKPAAEALAMGWERDYETATSHHELYTHTGGAWVAQWRPGERWAYGATRDAELSTDAEVDTRDEAMARALGYEPEEHSMFWRVPGKPEHGGAREDISKHGSWGAVRADYNQESGFPSLPHAIAWAMGHDQPTAVAQTKVSAEPATPKGWRSTGSFYEPKTPEYNDALVMRSGIGWRARRDVTRDDPGYFTNFHAACLHALGCEVRELPPGQPWKWNISSPEGACGWLSKDDELPALVEKLTEERARGR